MCTCLGLKLTCDILTMQIVKPMSYPARAGVLELQAVMQLGCSQADQAAAEQEVCLALVMSRSRRTREMQELAQCRLHGSSTASALGQASAWA